MQDDPCQLHGDAKRTRVYVCQSYRVLRKDRARLSVSELQGDEKRTSVREVQGAEDPTVLEKFYH